MEWIWLHSKNNDEKRVGWGGSKQAGFCGFSTTQQPAPEYYAALEQGEEHVYHTVVPVKSALSTKKKKKKKSSNLCSNW